MVFGAYRSSRSVEPWVVLAFAVTLIVGIVAILSLDYIRGSIVDVQEGEPSPERITAPQQKTYVSTYLTEQEKALAEGRVSDIYSERDRNIGRNQINIIRDLFAFITVIREDTFATEDENLDSLTAIEVVDVDADTASLLLGFTAAEIIDVEEETVSLIEAFMLDPIREIDLEIVRSDVDDNIGLNYSEAQEAVLSAITPQLLVANSFKDDVATTQAKQDARNSVADVQQTFFKDDVIVREGQVIGDFEIEALTEFGLLQSDANLWNIVRNFLLTSVTVGIIFLYFTHYKQRRFDRRRYLLLLTLLLLGYILAAQLLMPNQGSVAYLFPSAALALIVGVLFETRFGVIITIALAVFTGYITNGSLEFTLYVLIGGLMGLFTLRDAQRINSFFRASLIVMVFNIIIIAIFNVTPDVDPITLLPLAGAAVANGAIVASVTIAVFFIAGSAFGIVTMLQLQELSRFDNPLLQELLHRAPGTYHHSIIVANLAEQAADRIGADSLETRVGAFYHDIGKMQNAPYFSENQNGDNPHLVLAPEVSAEIIIGHVTNGLKMARRNRLPERIQDYIAEHHGDNLVKFFYKKACEAAGEAEREVVEVVDEARFRHIGPPPRSRETGIVMMADAVEATSKAVQPNNEKAIEKLVYRITDDLIADRQLDDSGLSLRDIKLIRESFVETLKGRFHVRVKYAGNEELVAANLPEIEAEYEPVPALDSAETNLLPIPPANGIPAELPPEAEGLQATTE